MSDDLRKDKPKEKSFDELWKEGKAAEKEQKRLEREKKGVEKEEVYQKKLSMLKEKHARLQERQTKKLELQRTKAEIRRLKMEMTGGGQFKSIYEKIKAKQQAQKRREPSDKAPIKYKKPKGAYKIVNVEGNMYAFDTNTGTLKKLSPAKTKPKKKKEESWL